MKGTPARRPRTAFRAVVLTLAVLCLALLTGSGVGQASPGQSGHEFMQPDGTPLARVPKAPPALAPEVAGLTSALGTEQATASPLSMATKKAASLAASVTTTRSLQSSAGTVASGPGIAGAVGSTTLIL